MARSFAQNLAIYNKYAKVGFNFSKYKINTQNFAQDFYNLAQMAKFHNDFLSHHNSCYYLPTT